MTLSNQAQVAKILRQHCKKLGIKCRATSESFSMGDSVRLTVYDQPPETMAALNKFAAPYQYGHFDGMTDMYEYSNQRDDIPQTKFLFVENDISDELRQAAWDFMRARISNAQSGPESAADARLHRMGDYWADSALHQFLNGSTVYQDLSAEFWASRETPAAHTVKVSSGYTIEEHTHTKRGFQMFIVVLAERVDREQFNALRDAAKDYGGWYSRAWQTTPGGFAFRTEDAAQNFAQATS